MRHISSYQALLKHHVDLKVYVYLTTYSGVPEWVYTYKLLFLCHIFPPSAPDFQCKLSSCFQAGVLGAEDCTSLLQAQKVKVTSASTILSPHPSLTEGLWSRGLRFPGWRHSDASCCSGYTLRSPKASHTHLVAHSSLSI